MNESRSGRQTNSGRQTYSGRQQRDPNRGRRRDIQTDNKQMQKDIYKHSRFKKQIPTADADSGRQIQPDNIQCRTIRNQTDAEYQPVALSKSEFRGFFLLFQALVASFLLLF
ncbi:hypothetical protein Tco_0688618 [Tanacetum coccineum]